MTLIDLTPGEPVAIGPGVTVTLQEVTRRRAGRGYAVFRPVRYKGVEGVEGETA